MLVVLLGPVQSQAGQTLGRAPHHLIGGVGEGGGGKRRGRRGGRGSGTTRRPARRRPMQVVGQAGRRAHGLGPGVGLGRGGNAAFAYMADAVHVGREAGVVLRRFGDGGRLALRPFLILVV